MSEEKKTLHPFERSLGPGPYTFMGVAKIVISPTVGAAVVGQTWGAGCGTCAHCGTGIIYNYIVKTGEGKYFAVGCDCIMKSQLPFHIKSAAEKARLEIERKKRQEKTQARREKERKEACERAALVEALLEKNPKLWDSEDHPNPYMVAAHRSTYRHYASWAAHAKAKHPLKVVLDKAKKEGLLP